MAGRLPWCSKPEPTKPQSFPCRQTSPRPSRFCAGATQWPDGGSPTRSPWVGAPGWRRQPADRTFLWREVEQRHSGPCNSPGRERGRSPEGWKGRDLRSRNPPGAHCGLTGRQRPPSWLLTLLQTLYKTKFRLTKLHRPSYTIFFVF